MKGVSLYHHWRGYKFSTYGTWWIRQLITRYIADHGATIRVPVHMRENLLKVEKFERKFHQLHGKSPSVDDIAKGIGVTPDMVRRIQKVVKSTRSMDEEIGEDGGTLGDFVADQNSVNPLDLMVSKEDRATLRAYIYRELETRSADIVCMRYGIRMPDENIMCYNNGVLPDGEEDIRFADNYEFEWDELSVIFNLTPERLRQIEQRGIRKLRSARRATRLKRL